jgi:hypothetical protein
VAWPLIQQANNLLVELAPGWWPLHANLSAIPAANRTSAQSKFASRIKVVSGGARNRVLKLDPAEVRYVRERGAEQIARLLRPPRLGGAGFAAALTSTGKILHRPERLHAFLLSMGSNGYWNQEDMWFARDADTIHRARQLICLRQRTHRSERSALEQCTAREARSRAKRERRLHREVV